MRLIARIAALAAVGAAVACGRPDSEAGEAGADPARGAPMAEIPGMDHGTEAQNGGMGAMTSESMIGEMRSHLAQIQGAGADSLRQIMPAHRQMAANLLAQMNTEMRQMNMSADSAWSALVDSVRRDLARMPELAPSEMAAFMAAHLERVRRLMERHGAMM